MIFRRPDYCWVDHCLSVCDGEQVYGANVEKELLGLEVDPAVGWCWQYAAAGAAGKSMKAHSVRCNLRRVDERTAICEATSATWGA